VLESQRGLRALPDQTYPTRWLERLPSETTSEGREPIFQVPGAWAILASAASADDSIADLSDPANSGSFRHNPDKPCCAWPILG
jgi:hypothetical protein